VLGIIMLETKSHAAPKHQLGVPARKYAGTVQHYELRTG
jgi:hypothetical protein